jgi:hypothetical protein
MINSTTHALRLTLLDGDWSYIKKKLQLTLVIDCVDACATTGWASVACDCSNASNDCVNASARDYATAIAWYVRDCD